MRVAVMLEQCLAPVPGGTGRYARELAAGLVRTKAPGDTVAGWTAWHRDTADARVPGVAGPTRLPLGHRPLTLAWEHGRGPVPARADLVHATTLLVPPRRRRPGRLVVSIHDAVPWTHPETLTARGVRWHRAMGERVAADADAVIAPTRAVAGELARHLSLDEAKVHVVGLGVTTAVTTPPPDAGERARRLGLPAGGYLLTLATLEPRKGLDTALAALALPGSPDLPLLVVGRPGWGGVDPLAEARRLGLPPGRVRLLGWLDDADVATALSRASVLVAPSRSEGFGLPVLEAMAQGLPVVHTDVPALVEVSAGAAVVVPVGDAGALGAALREAVGDARLRQRLAEAGRRRAAAFSWDGAAAACWTVYRAL